MRVLEQAYDDLGELLLRKRSQARSHSEVEARVHEGERISAAIRRAVRG